MERVLDAFQERVLNCQYSETNFMISGGLPKLAGTYSFSVQFAMLGANPGDLFSPKA